MISLARRRVIRLLGGAIEFETPILIPSLSSKALGPILSQVPGKTVLDLRVASLVHSESLIDGIEESLLISSYDIKHALLNDAAKFRRGFRNSRWSKPNLLIIDSGWYEKSVGPPGGQYVHEAGAALSWARDDFEHTVDSLDRTVRAVVVNWDGGLEDSSEATGSHPQLHGTYPEQRADAQDFFGSRSRFASNLLLKPPRGRRFHNFGDLAVSEAEDLRAFDIIGVTEKELGDSIMDRLRELASLRTLLNKAEVETPIHVFGGLDPLYTPLYVAAGAEIFDGLGWLRYAYGKDGRAIHRDAAPLIDGDVTKRWSQTVMSTQLRNLDEMAQLAEELKMFAHAGADPAKLRPRIGEVIAPVLERLDWRLEETSV